MPWEPNQTRHMYHRPTPRPSQGRTAHGGAEGRQGAIGRRGTAQASGTREGRPSGGGPGRGGGWAVAVAAATIKGTADSGVSNRHTRAPNHPAANSQQRN
jgi:hypothetical protein